MPDKNYSDHRLNNIINLLIEYSQGQFDMRLTVTESDDELNTVASGLNMLGEELAHNERQIIESRNFLQNILSSIDEVIYARQVGDDSPLGGYFTFISDRTEVILGIPVTELIDAPGTWIDAIHPDDAVNLSEKVDDLLQGNETVFIYRLHHKQKKEYIWLEDRVIPKKNEKGVVTAFFGSARDITEQKKTNIELKDKNELISRLVTTSDQFFYIVAIDKEDNYRNNFTYCSWQIENIQGTAPHELKEDPYAWQKAIHPEDRISVEEKNRHMFTQKTPVVRVYRVIHKKTGKYIWLEDYVVPVTNSDGEIKELYGSVRDISERKKDELEKENLIKELSNKVNEAMQFNYIVSHNLRAPVAHIKGLVELLDTGMPSEDLKTTLQYISEAAHSMDELINDLNTILSARSDINEKFEPVILTEILHTVCSNLKKEIKLSKAVIDIVIEPAADKVFVIKSYMQSIIFNLISNAIKYRHPDRPLRISISSEKKVGHIVIKIADNGLGIDLEKHGQTIFGIYSRFHLTHEGKGLGLHMTKTQVESIGGTIAVESTPNEGSVFTIMLKSVSV